MIAGPFSLIMSRIFSTIPGCMVSVLRYVVRVRRMECTEAGFETGEDEMLAELDGRCSELRTDVNAVVVASIMIWEFRRVTS